MDGYLNLEWVNKYITRKTMNDGTHKYVIYNIDGTDIVDAVDTETEALMVLFRTVRYYEQRGLSWPK